jgi:lipoprotein-anchoring transpeptidase ErfK/SrfK
MVGVPVLAGAAALAARPLSGDPKTAPTASAPTAIASTDVRRVFLSPRMCFTPSTLASRRPLRHRALAPSTEDRGRSPAASRLKWTVGRTDLGARGGYVRSVARSRFFDGVRADPRRWLLAALVVAALTGCGGAKADSLAPTPASPTPSHGVKVFFVKGEQFAARTRAVPAGEAAASVAMRALVAGPTSAERAAGIDTAMPAGTTLASLSVRAGTATVNLTRARTASTAFDVSLRPARAAQIVYTLTSLPTVKQVLIRVNGLERATFIGSKLALKGPLDKHDLSKPILLPAAPRQVPKGHAPADPRGVQKRLVSLGYLPANSVTGTWNARTSHAVLAFQAWERLTRDGIVGPQTLAALENAARPKPAGKLGGRRVEVYREKGVTLLVENRRVVRALHSSSGKRAYETPAGSFSVFRKERNSWSVPYQVWLPYASYFTGGIAFHAYPDVPTHPVSHGCVRLPVAEAPFAYGFMSIGTRVTVY